MESLRIIDRLTYCIKESLNSVRAETVGIIFSKYICIISEERNDCIYYKKRESRVTDL